jgi:diguanylate cyclase
MGGDQHNRGAAPARADVARRPRDVGGVLPGRLAESGNLPRAVHPLRMLGMALAGLPIGAVLLEIDADWPAWACLAFTSLAWPQLARLLSHRARDPYRAELRNLLVDSAIAGVWVPLLHFNLLPSVLLTTLATVDKINTGVRGLWWRAAPWLLGGLLAGGLATGFAFRPATSMQVVLACMPLLLIHTIAVSLNGYRLVRTVKRQNRMLDALHRTDRLTGLQSRDHWEEQAAALLERSRLPGHDASLLIFDVDRFKETNDRCGHAAGDELLRQVGGLLRRHAGTGHAGRWGGDEFVVALPIDGDTAHRLAEHILREARDIAHPHADAPPCTLSVGVADAGDASDLRTWLLAADRALYRAKHAGRDRVARAQAGEVVGA